jgi:hypothetical protein
MGDEMDSIEEMLEKGLDFDTPEGRAQIEKLLK